MSASPRILITRLTALGDTVHSVPVACALRERFPHAFIAWVVEGVSAEIVRHHPALDQVIPLRRRWWQSLAEVRKARAQLRELQFDISVDVQGLTKSSILGWMSGAKRRLGFAAPHGRELSTRLNNELVECNAAHIIEHYLEVLRPLGIHNPSVRFDLPSLPEDESYVDDVLTGLSLRGGEFALLNAGSAWPSKLWPPERFGQLAIHLQQRHNLPSIALWGVDQELPDAEIIAATSRGAARVAPPTTIGQLVALSRRAGLFVGGDTGPLHLAVAVGAPSVSLHGTTRSNWSGAYGPHNIAVQACYSGGTARQRRAMDNTAMRAITLEMVAEACDRVIGSRHLARAS